MMKRALIRTRTCSSAAILALALGGCGPGEEQIFNEVISPDGTWNLRVTVAEPRMPQGPFYVAAYLLKVGAQDPVKLFQIKLENDGVPFTATNIAPRWVSANTALVCLRASDLPDRGMRIETSAKPHAVEVDQC